MCSCCIPVVIAVQLRGSQLDAQFVQDKRCKCCASCAYNAQLLLAVNCYPSLEFYYGVVVENSSCLCRSKSLHYRRLGSGGAMMLSWH